ncbi:MAG: hypothetical protein OIF54_17780, partial [Cohaesibacter sp.]|nr:hypothetical protein [Cohaesibacter sp.]
MGFEHYPSAWSRSIVPSPDRLRKFWSTNISHPAMVGNPLADCADLRDRIIPISFHGDDVPITGVGKSWCSQMSIFSWSSQIGFGTIQRTANSSYGEFLTNYAISTPTRVWTRLVDFQGAGLELALAIFGAMARPGLEWQVVPS